MTIINDKRKLLDFYGSIEPGTYFEISPYCKGRYFIKTNIHEDHGELDNYFAVDIMTGERHLFSDSVSVMPLSVEINLT